MTTTLAGIALVTGGSRGLGAAIVGYAKDQNFYTHN